MSLFIQSQSFESRARYREVSHKLPTAKPISTGPVKIVLNIKQWNGSDVRILGNVEAPCGMHNGPGELRRWRKDTIEEEVLGWLTRDGVRSRWRVIHQGVFDFGNFDASVEMGREFCAFSDDRGLSLYGC